MSPMSPHRRRVLALRHRQHTWEDALDQLYDRDGRHLSYALCLAKEGVGTWADAFDGFAKSCHDLLGVMAEARPEEAATVTAEWQAWFSSYPRPRPWSAHRRDVLLLRHQDHAWQAAADRLFATGAEGGPVQAEPDDARREALLAQMVEARPIAGAALVARWRRWRATL